ncbi:MAG: alpha-L-fucosidase [Puniceicoccales bacterium]|jgi:alpha-L-fucosidase|nr:alpha-L-fucosidase [Puniceicoccales bacterium]
MLATKNGKTGKRILTALFAAVLALQATPSAQAEEMDVMWGEQESKEADANVKRGRFFDSGNYAMFVHWGLYSHIANRWEGKNFYGIGEWIMHEKMAGISIEKYRAVAKEFNPTQFDAKKLAQLAKDAGMKYIIITSKHHDGFAMYHSQCDKFNIVDATPFARDPMKELSEACKELGLGFGFYYSHNQDWTHPGGGNGPKTDAAGKAKTFDDYFAEKCLPQVEEITKNYGDIELIWFDTPGKMPRKYAKQLVDVVHRNQPRALVSGRVGHGLGDYRTFGDMEVPLENVPGLWEGVDVTNDSWGYAWYDNNWKSPKQILGYLIATVARGGTYMLNVGPDATGQVPAPAQASLRAAGQWIARYPQVVYSAKPSPWKHALPWGDAVVNNGKIYLVVFNWPTSGKLHVPGLQSQVASVKLLRDGAKTEDLTFIKEGDWLVINTPWQTPDKNAAVLAIEPKDKVRIDTAQALDPEFGLRLSAKFAKAENSTIRYIKWMEKFGEWKHMHQIGDWRANSSATWEFEVKNPGNYLVELTYTANGPRVWNVKSDEGEVIQNRQNGSTIYHAQPIGWIAFKTAGRHRLTVTIPEGERATTSLSTIKITPVEL